MLIRPLICLLFAISCAIGLPVKEKPKETEQTAEKPSDDSPTQNLENVIEYERYLKEVVNALESDKEFRKKLDSASEADIRSGKIAQELELVDHNVRSKLDELKRTELQRQSDLARQFYELSNDIDREHFKIPEHLDHENQHTFEIEDLKKLILKTSEDLAEADRRRRGEFKEYELQKEFEHQEKLRSLDEEHKKTYEAELKKQHEKHDKHEKVHHPGSLDQLEEVWEKQDHMDKQDFDPKAFFMMHDLDGNNFWDENEVKALFVQELNKVYQQGGVPEDDLRERAEEMERMREHVFKEADVNKDGLISFDEFLEQTKRDEFKKDPGWDTVDNQQQYTHEEYLEFERRRQEEIQRMIQDGRLPPHPNMPQGYYPGPGNNGQYQHPNDIQHGYPAQGNPNVQYNNQQYPNPQYPNQVPNPQMQEYQQNQQNQYKNQQPIQQQINSDHARNQAQQFQAQPNQNKDYQHNQVYEHVSKQNENRNQQQPGQPINNNNQNVPVPDPKIENKPVQVNQNQNHPQNAPAQQPLNSSPQNIPVQNAPSPQVNNAQPSVHHV